MQPCQSFISDFLKTTCSDHMKEETLTVPEKLENLYGWTNLIFLPRNKYSKFKW